MSATAQYAMITGAKIIPPSQKDQGKGMPDVRTTNTGAGVVIIEQYNNNAHNHPHVKTNSNNSVVCLVALIEGSGPDAGNANDVGGKGKSPTRTIVNEAEEELGLDLSTPKRRHMIACDSPGVDLTRRNGDHIYRARLIRVDGLSDGNFQRMMRQRRAQGAPHHFLEMTKLVHLPIYRINAALHKSPQAKTITIEAVDGKKYKLTARLTSILRKGLVNKTNRQLFGLD
tara:strand:+ start:1786 stop:2469 length:684 start_codon:yes stop_codon:yes gene_type:complete